MMKLARWAPGKPISVIGAVSAQRGLIAYQLKDKAIKAVDVAAFLDMVHEQMDGAPWHPLWDNAKIHGVAEAVKEKLDELRLVDLRNLEYRPDLMGLELVWRDMKLHYRKTLVKYLAMGRPFQNKELVQRAIDSVSAESVKSSAQIGLDKMMAAETLPPLRITSRKPDKREPTVHKWYLDNVFGVPPCKME